MALVDKATGRTKSFRACSRYFAVDEPVTVAVAPNGGPYTCPAHGGTACVETFYSASDLVGTTFLQMLRLRRYWRREATS